MSLVVRFEFKGSKQLGDNGPTRWILFVHYCNFKMGDGQPGEQEGERSRLGCPNDSRCLGGSADRRASARLEANETMCPLSCLAAAPSAFAKSDA